MTDLNVADGLRRHAHERGAAAALMFPASGYTTAAPAWDTWTFHELDCHSDAYARGFVAQGIRRGDRTLLLVKPSLHFYAVLFGLFKLGAVPVLLDPGMGARNLLTCIERTAPRAVIAMSAVHAVRTVIRRPFAAAEILITAGRRWFWGGSTLDTCHVAGEAPFEVARLGPQEDAAIIFTSGSTGVAKGVTSTQAMFAAQVRALGEMFDLTPGRIDHQAFAAFAIFDIALGMTSVIPKMNLSRPATADPADIVACLQGSQADVAFASPVVWQTVSRHCQEHGERLPHVKTLLTVGAPIPAYLHRRYRALLEPGVQVYTPYGATEAMPISSIGTDEILNETWDRTARGAGTCVGAPAPGATVRIIAITDAPIHRWSDDLALPPDTLGEVVVGGEQTSPAYKDAPAANAAAKIADGDRVLHRMGDLGYLDDTGRLWFCGRKSHRLQTAAGVLPAVPVEGIYNEDPDVFRTALVGVGPVGEEVPVLCVELEPGTSWHPALAERLSALGEGTPYAGRVQRFLAHTGFPTDARHNSKIRREDLRPWAAARCADLLSGAI